MTETERTGRKNPENDTEIYNSFQVTDRNPSFIGTENCPTDGKKIVPMTERKLSPNKILPFGLWDDPTQRPGKPVHKRILSGRVKPPWNPTDVGRILRTFKIKKNVEVTDNGKIII